MIPHSLLDTRTLYSTIEYVSSFLPLYCYLFPFFVSSSLDLVSFSLHRVVYLLSFANPSRVESLESHLVLTHLITFLS